MRNLDSHSSHLFTRRRKKARMRGGVSKKCSTQKNCDQLGTKIFWHNRHADLRTPGMRTRFLINGNGGGARTQRETAEHTWDDKKKTNTSTLFQTTQFQLERSPSFTAFTTYHLTAHMTCRTDDTFCVSLGSQTPCPQQRRTAKPNESECTPHFLRHAGP